MADFKASPEDIARFLQYISQLESSGGKNTNHPTMHTGIHAGDTAEGQYGLMPNTKDELMKRYPAELTDDSSNDAYANKLAERVLNRSKGDETTAAGLWNQGHNAPEEAFPDIRDSAYAQKYEQMRRQVPEALDANPYYNNEDVFPTLQKILRGK